MQSLKVLGSGGDPTSGKYSWVFTLQIIRLPVVKLERLNRPSPRLIH